MKRSYKITVIIIAFFVCWFIFALGYSFGNGNKAQASTDTTNVQPNDTPVPTNTPLPTATPKPTPTPKPTRAPQWTTVDTFSGQTGRKTTLFTVPDSWRLVWTCDPSSNYDGEYNVMIDVKGSDGSDVDPGAVNTICKAGNTGDTTQEYQGGTVYLDITADAFTVQVQVLQ